ncbi:segregation/condensation protein A [Patescibacteria group bacterium]|nr:segregation/condensation protein A [Patescibacteria group bacterium]MBU1673943.1 segregation/condensation protein A [Patescibacteria group bacterium]MBU1963937.1 segregation/condensation protein A [Patescibacteria group bacterium]
MEYKVRLEQFQGPLDLLLNLIEEEKLDITEISLSKVTKQYVDHLDKVEELYPEELADFLVVATKLLLLKSRTLLPYLQVDDDEEETNLEEQLKVYKEYAEASKVMEKILLKGNFAYGRPQAKPSTEEVIFSPPKKKMTPKELREIFQLVLKSLEPIVRLPKAAIDKAVTLKEKICAIQDVLHKELKTSFNHLTGKGEQKADIVVTFLALLELVRKQMVCVTQDEHFADITIEKNRE